MNNINSLDDLCINSFDLSLKAGGCIPNSSVSEARTRRWPFPRTPIGGEAIAFPEKSLGPALKANMRALCLLGGRDKPLDVKDTSAHKAKNRKDYDMTQGHLMGRPLLGPNGKPMPKGTGKEKLKLSSSRGDADLDAEKRRDKAHKRGCINVGQVKPDVVVNGHDDVASNHNGRSYWPDMRDVCHREPEYRGDIPQGPFASDVKRPVFVKPRANSPFKRVKKPFLVERR